MTRADSLLLFWLLGVTFVLPGVLVLAIWLSAFTG